MPPHRLKQRAVIILISPTDTNQRALKREKYTLQRPYLLMGRKQYNQDMAVVRFGQMPQPAFRRDLHRKPGWQVQML
jgi:hypothetical protein